MNSEKEHSVHPCRLLRLPQVLEILPVSRSHFLDGVNKGIFPKPVKLSERVTCWRSSEIYDLVNSLEVAS